MPSYSARSLLQIVPEVAYGSFVTPDPLLHAVICYDLKAGLMDGASLPRAPSGSATLAKPTSVPYGRFVKLTFGCDFVTPNLGGTAGPLGPLLRACGMNEGSGVSTVYRGVNTAFESISAFYHADGMRQAIAGLRGTWSLAIQRGQIPRINFELWGIRLSPGDIAMPTVSFSAWPNPTVVNKANSTFSLGGVALALERLNINYGNKLFYHDKPGYRGSDIIERETTGDITFEAEPLATHDPFTLASAATLGVLSFAQAGVPAGSALVTLNKCQLERPDYADIDGIRHITSPLRSAAFGFAAADDVTLNFA